MTVAQTPTPAAATPDANEPGAAGEKAKADGASGTSTWTVSDVAIVPAHVSEVPNPLPKPWIETPGFEQVLGKDWVPGYKVLLKLTNWNQPPQGSYVQFVFDGRPLPPVAYHGGIKLTDIAGPDGVSEGEHVLAAYLCLGNHQSIKAPGGISVHRFWVGKKTAGQYQSNAPMLVLGSPFGTYSGSAGDDLIIDWYVLNAPLGDKQYTVRMTLKGPGLPDEGTQAEATEWRAWTITSPHNGEYALKVELFDPNGKLAPGTTIERSFKVEGRSD